MKPDLEQIPSFYQPYVQALDNDELTNLMKDSLDRFLELTANISEEHGNYRYAPEKWSLKQVIQHLIDGERVFTYRALRFSRGDNTDLPGFDQDEYATTYQLDHRSVKELIEEFKLIRMSTTAFYESLNPDQFDLKGTANQYGFSVNAIGYITVGHLVHHLNIIEERYLQPRND